MTVQSDSLSLPRDQKGQEPLQLIEDLTMNTDAYQEEILCKILTQNANSEYLKRFGLNAATDRYTFKSKVPVVTYEDLRPDIERIANGDRSPILCAHPISEFLTRYTPISLSLRNSRMHLYLSYKNVIHGLILRIVL